MAPSHLDLITEILAHVWHAPILRALADGPLRYSRIGATLVEHVGNRPGDGYISEELKRLQDLGLVTRQPVPKTRYHMWALTDDGRRAVDTLASLAGGPGRSAAASAGAHPEAGDGSAQAGHQHGRQSDQAPQPPDQGLTSADNPTSSTGLEAVLSRLDVSQPHPARRYNYWLGGKDHFAADRESGDKIEQLVPNIRLAAVENRRFQRRVVRYLTGEAGIRQIIDIGTGIPGPDNTHEVAQAIDPTCRVVYVDNDPVVLAHARALLSSTPEGATAYIEADARRPESILEHPEALATIDFDQPTAVLLIAVLHFINDDDIHRLINHLINAMTPKSYLAISHATTDFMSAEEKAKMAAEVATGRHGDMWPRAKDQLAELLSGLQLLPPGIQSIAEWRADDEPQPRPAPEETTAYGAVWQIP